MFTRTHICTKYEKLPKIILLRTDIQVTRKSTENIPNRNMTIFQKLFVLKLVFHNVAIYYISQSYVFGLTIPICQPLTDASKSIVGPGRTIFCQAQNID